MLKLSKHGKLEKLGMEPLPLGSIPSLRRFSDRWWTLSSGQ